VILHEPEIKKAGEEITISSRVEINSPNTKGRLKSLWVKVPEGQGAFISDYSNGFAVALLFLAMNLGEDLEIRGKMSPRLLFGMMEFQKCFKLWFSETLRKIIDIQCEKLIPQTQENNTMINACAFSGGVDSFYTLWSHLPGKEKLDGFQISHALFVGGVSSPTLEDEETYKLSKLSYEKVTQKLNVKLLTAETNFKEAILDKVSKNLAYGTSLIGTILILSQKFSHFYISSGYPYQTPFIEGTNFRTDHLLSTESLELINDGASVSRLQKTAVIAQWPETFSHLRVCWHSIPDMGFNNCCRCAKCIRTMVSLSLLGALSKYPTFPKPLRRRDILNARFLSDGDRYFIHEIIDYAASEGRADVAFYLRCALWLSSVSKWLKQKAPALHQALCTLLGKKTSGQEISEGN